LKKGRFLPGYSNHGSSLWASFKKKKVRGDKKIKSRTVLGGDRKKWSGGNHE